MKSNKEMAEELLRIRDKYDAGRKAKRKNLRFVILMAAIITVLVAVAIPVAAMITSGRQPGEETKRSTPTGPYVTTDNPLEPGPVTLDLSNYTVYQSDVYDDGKSYVLFPLYPIKLPDTSFIKDGDYQNTKRKVSVNGVEYEGEYQYSSKWYDLDVLEYRNYNNEYQLNFAFFDGSEVLCSLSYSQLDSGEIYKDAKIIDVEVALQKAKDLFREQYGDPDDYYVYNSYISRNGDKYKWQDYYVFAFERHFGDYHSKPVVEIGVSCYDVNYIRRINANDLYLYFELIDDFEIAFDQIAFEESARKTLIDSHLIKSVNGFEYYINIVDQRLILECSVSVSYSKYNDDCKYTLYIVPSE